MYSMPKTKTFNGKRYSLAGRGKPESKSKLTKWADFQRRVNGYSVRLVKVGTGYVPYLRKS